MRIAIIIALLLSAVAVPAQKDLTVIVVRHVEKDYSDPDKADPELSPVGKERAKLLWRAVRQYRINRAYSTDYTRTRETLRLIVEKRNLQIQTYGGKALKELAGEIKALKKGRRVIVSGHSNTTPFLVNFLIGENKYEEMNEFTYNKFFVVKVRNGKATVEVVTY